MVKAAGFIEGMADNMGLPVETLRVAYRALRTEGLLTTGARGVNAPDMIALDAARMLIWGLVSDRPIDAANAVRDFGPLPFVKAFQRNQLYNQYHHDHFKDTPSLERAIADVLIDYVDGSDFSEDVKFVELEIQSSDLIAILTIDGTGYEFSYPFINNNGNDDTQDLRRANAARFDLGERYHRKLKQIRLIGPGELQEIADMIADR